MTFRKYASAVPMGTLQLSEGKLTKCASALQPVLDARVAADAATSIYLSEGARHIDVQAAINSVAEKYRLSKNVDDYFFEVVKAVKSGGFNNNYDGFPRDEQLRYLLKHAKVAYRTFETKPHHLNHKVDIAEDARGFILDASYNDLSAPLDNCPQCNATTRLASERSSDGLHCRKCGHIVKSEFVECLLAMDQSKDPTFASHVKSGTLNATSMGCFIEGTPITMADGTRCPIEKIRPDDRIITHSGKIAAVKETSVHTHEDLVYRIAVQGLNEQIVATGNHPFWVVDPETGVGQWLEADQLKVGQFLRSPNLKQESVDVDNEFARLAGYFVSEGNFIKAYDGPHCGQRVGVEFTFNATEQHYIDEVFALLQKYGNSPHVYARPSRNTLTVKDYRCKALAERLFTLVGQHAVDKTLSSEILAWPKEAQLHFIGAWLNGDGCSIDDATHSWSEITTSSVNLKDQLCQMLVNLGIPHRLRWVESGFNGRRATSVIISSNDQLRLRAYSDKVKRNRETLNKTATRADKDGILRKIKAVTTEDFSGPVYNFEVADADHSYVAGGVAVHNCSCEETECNVCGNIARSAEEFCTHIKGAKGSWFKRAVSAQKDANGRTAQVVGPWSRSNIRELRAALQTCGYNPKCAETTTRVVAGATEFALSAEHCRYFAYDELSRVAKPAEPTALTIEIFDLNRRAAESSALALAKSAQEGKITMSKFFVVAVDGSHLDTHAAPTLKEAVKLAQPDANSKLTYVAVEAPDEDTARGLYLAHEKSAQAVPSVEMPVAAPAPSAAAGAPGAAPMQVDSSVTVEVPDGMQIQMVDAKTGNPVTPPQDPAMDPAGAPAAPGAPGATPANPSDAMAPAMTPESMGVMPPKSGSWAGKYAGFVVDVGEQFTIVANERDEPIFTVRNASLIKSKTDGAAQAALIQNVVAQQGLLGAARVLKAEFVVDAADATGIGDMKGAPKQIGDQSLSRVDPAAEPESDGLTDKQREPVNVGSERDEAEVNIARDRIIAEAVEAARATDARRYEAVTTAAVKRARSEAYDAAVDDVLRALKVVAKRAALNLEESHLKGAMFTALTTEREVGKTARGESVTTNPMPEDIAQFHIESAWAEAAEKDIAAVVASAAVLAKAGPEYLKAAEADMAKQTVPLPRIAHLIAAVDDSTQDPNQRRSAAADFVNASPEVAREVRDSMARMNFDGGRRTAPMNHTSGGRANGRQ